MSDAEIMTTSEEVILNIVLEQYNEVMDPRNPYHQQWVSAKIVQMIDEKRSLQDVSNLLYRTLLPERHKNAVVVADETAVKIYDTLGAR